MLLLFSITETIIGNISSFPLKIRVNTLNCSEMETWPGTQCLKDRWASSNNTLKHLYNDSCYLNREGKKKYFNSLSSPRLMRVPLQRPVSRNSAGQESGCSLPFETNYFLHPGQHLSLIICVTFYPKCWVKCQRLEVSPSSILIKLISNASCSAVAWLNHSKPD